MMGWVYLVAVLSLALYLGTLMIAGQARRRYQVPAPVMTGPPGFERAMRVQANTLESLVPFLPALLLAAELVNPLWAAVLGAVWLTGRALYIVRYLADPGTRGPGFIIAFAGLIGLLLMAGWGALRVILAHA